MTYLPYQLVNIDWIKNGESLTGDPKGVYNECPVGTLNRSYLQIMRDMVSLKNEVNAIGLSTSINGINGDVSLVGAISTEYDLYKVYTGPMVRIGTQAYRASEIHFDPNVFEFFSAGMSEVGPVGVGTKAGIFSGGPGATTYDPSGTTPSAQTTNQPTTQPPPPVVRVVDTSFKAISRVNLTDKDETNNSNDPSTNATVHVTYGGEVIKGTSNIRWVDDTGIQITSSVPPHHTYSIVATGNLDTWNAWRIGNYGEYSGPMAFGSVIKSIRVEYTLNGNVLFSDWLTVNIYSIGKYQSEMLPKYIYI